MTWIIQFNKLKYKPNLVICMPLKNSDITTSATHYYWGKDLFGSFQGAGGVGGLLYLTIDGSTFVPLYDNNGNITHYLDTNGNTVAQYTYDAFGNTIAQSGLLANTFRHRYSTKYLDTETGLYYYGYRFYHPTLMRWLNRDPIEEDGGVNLYAFCGNSSVIKCDMLGKLSYDLVEKNYPIKSIYSDDISDSTNIWKHIGGKVLVNAEIGVFKNPCAIRLSLTLNKSGLIIPYIEGATSSGRNFDGATSSKWWYIFRVKDMKKFLSQKLGAAKIYKSRQAFENCAPKGILILDISGWSDATGHATLWNGEHTIDAAQDSYFSKPNVIFNLWSLK